MRCLLPLFVHWELNDGSQLRLKPPCTRLLYAEHVKYDEERTRDHPGFAERRTWKQLEKEKNEKV
jgi:hypothetical protein